MKKQQHFHDWTVYSVNCCSGCSNNCRYCYAKGMAVRFGQLTPEDWPLERVRPKDVAKKYRLYKGRVMFPSSHDITPKNMDACLTDLGKLVAAGNEILVVSKPRLACTQQLCHSFKHAKGQILFRFTIGAMDDTILRFWEPGAPSYGERLASLVHAFETGYRTSVSIEPMLDSDHTVELVDSLYPFVNDTIWLGVMNHIKKDVQIDSPETAQAVEAIMAGQADDRIREIYNNLKDCPKIRWKSQIKRVVGLPMPQDAGMDI
jgi:DNA repair photolyase